MSLSFDVLKLSLLPRREAEQMNAHTQANGGLVNFDNQLYGNENQGTQTSVHNGVALGIGTNGGPHYDIPRGKQNIS